MKVGGNGSATDFFTKHGGSTLLTESDTKKKYTGKVADLYKEELARRVKEDIARFPTRLFVEGMPDITSSADVKAAEDEDDFFSSWNKPPSSPQTPSSSSSSTLTAPPVIGRPSSVGNGTVSSAPRTVTSSSLRSSSASSSRPKLGASRLNSSSTTTTSGSAPKKGKIGGLGAKKAASPMDFAEAERKAAEEAERIKQLGYDRLKEEEEERAKAKKAEEERQTASRNISVVGKVTSSTPVVANKPRGNAQDMERLGMGMKKMGFGAVPTSSAPASTSSSVQADSAPTFAREKFGGQKAISSDMYFGRNDYDPHVVNEAQSRLQTFQGASSISSNQYFGREEEEDELNGIPRSSEGLLGDGSLANLEIAAKDAIAKVLANPDVQNVGESIRAGALKLSDYLAQMSER